MSIWHYQELLTSPPTESRVTLGEGQTPLVASRRIGPAIGLHNLHWKLEIANPTGSYKDRFAAAAISHMRGAGERLCIATSSGNTGSALAAYCAAVDMPCCIAIVETAPAGKLVQMLAYGAKLLRVRGFGLDPNITKHALDRLAEYGRHPEAALQISAYCHSPLGMNGVQTISYEIMEQLSTLDHVFVPAGGGGLTLAIARGFDELVKSGRIERSPKVHCVQPEGNPTIAGPLRRGEVQAQTVECTSKISGLQVPIVLDGDEVIIACRATGGNGFVVPDGECFSAQRRLAREEGVFCEPAGAVALAGLLQAVQLGEVSSHESAVCIVTGTGFKDLASAEAMIADANCPLVEWTEMEFSV